MGASGISITHHFRAPIDLLWKVWTEPDHLKNWWGPEGFGAEIHMLELREGGEWKMTLFGPDGKSYPNRSVFKEIDPQKKIVFEHFNPHFVTTVLFESERGETSISWELLFDSVEMREIIVSAHRADEGQ